ncbi:MAG: VWA domain-containing protein, partial [Candidatus Korarchaeota archaeon]|nr:VWA domain-containing protein [Candidatus Korarchaeota archaeon]
IVILLDHSSSIASHQLEYKKATLALCEVLAYLKVKFAVYAFSTKERQVVCWLIKPDNMKWNYVCA